MKKNINLYLKLVLALGAGLLIGWLVFRGGASEGESTNEIVEGNPPTIWTCSMHPQIRQNGPGDCPICGMDLIPLEQDQEDSNPRAIKMSNSAMQLAEVRTAKVTAGDSKKEISLNGKLAVDERLEYTQSSHIPGRIEDLKVSFTGDLIRKGQVIAHVYSPELSTAQEELLEAQKLQETQPLLFEAAKKKLLNWRMTSSQIEEVLIQGKPIDKFPILADVSGYVTQKFVNLGDYISTGQPIYEIADLSEIWALFDVYESDLEWIKKGDEVQFKVQSFAEKSFTGRITYLDPVIDPQTRVAKARVIVKNPRQMLKPEMFVSGNVTSQLVDSGESLTIPKSAVLWTGKRSIVYVKLPDPKTTHFELREIELGPSLGDRYVVVEGLEVGEEIAVNGAFSIDAAAQLAGKPSMMSPPENGGPGNESSQNTLSANFEPGPKSQAELEPLLPSYFEFKDALVGDNLEGGRKGARKLLQGIQKVDNKVFESDALAYWEQNASEMEKALEHLDHFGDIEQLRDAFMLVSNAMIAVSDAFQLGHDSIYIQHCPMANSDQGADWISREQAILNPYFGASMLKCGEVKRPIQ